MPGFRIALPGYRSGSGSTRVKSMGIRIQESLINVDTDLGDLINVDPDPGELNQCGFESRRV
jgi:hypothetical protein